MNVCYQCNESGSGIWIKKTKIIYYFKTMPGVLVYFIWIQVLSATSYNFYFLLSLIWKNKMLISGFK